MGQDPHINKLAFFKDLKTTKKSEKTLQIWWLRDIWCLQVKVSDRPSKSKRITGPIQSCRLSVCAIRCSFSWGLSLALRSQDQFQASHCSLLPPSLPPPIYFDPINFFWNHLNHFWLKKMPPSKKEFLIDPSIFFLQQKNTFTLPPKKKCLTPSKKNLLTTTTKKWTATTFFVCFVLQFFLGSCKKRVPYKKKIKIGPPWKNVWPLPPPQKKIKNK